MKHWTCALVWSRYLAAFDTLDRLPDSARPRGVRSFWPAVIRDFADALAAEETRREEGYPFARSWTRRAPPSHRAVDLMEEVWSWHAKYLSEEREAARVLIAMAWCRARRRPLKIVFRSLDIRRREAYRTRDKALDLVRAGLTRDRALPAPFAEVLLS
jgi:hypothetical protein